MKTVQKKITVKNRNGSGKLRGQVRELEQKLSEMHTRAVQAEAVLTFSAAPIYTVDRELLITSINDIALQAMGYRRDEVVGKMTCAGGGV